MEDAPPPSGKTILVVDDERHIARLISVNLEKAGHATAIAYDGQEALDWLAENPPPALIFLDVMMPRVDGFQVRDAVRADPPLAAVPIVFLTARSGSLETERAWFRGDNGGDPFLSKPFQPDQIIRMAEHAMAGGTGTLADAYHPPMEDPRQFPVAVRWAGCMGFLLLLIAAALHFLGKH